MRPSELEKVLEQLNEKMLDRLLAKIDQLQEENARLRHTIQRLHEHDSRYCAHRLRSARFLPPARLVCARYLMRPLGGHDDG